MAQNGGLGFGGVVGSIFVAFVVGRGCGGFLGGFLVVAGDGERWGGERVETGLADDGGDLGLEGGDLFVGGLALGDEGVDFGAGVEGLPDDVGFGAEHDVTEGERGGFLGHGGWCV